MAANSIFQVVSSLKLDSVQLRTIQDLRKQTSQQSVESVKKVFEPVREKTNTLGSDQVRHKQGCTVTEAD